MKTKIVIVIALLVTAISSCTNSESKLRYVRKNANSDEALSDIQALDSAMSIMRLKGCDDPTSWYYQAAIHWVPSHIDSNKLCESYSDWTELKMAWDECTHSHGGAEEINFLIWHRLYIWHLEKIVRKLSGKADFALPYWGYTNYDKRDKIMPKQWRDVNSSLYEEARFDSLNNGHPISGGTLRVIDGTYPKLMQITDYQTFNSYFDQNIHGQMHNYIGSGNNPGSVWYYNKIYQRKSHFGMMSEVPSAAFDPIFWAHHSNIDRVFQQWLNSPNGKKITLQQLKDNPWKYQFFDENGKSVVYTPEEVLAIVYNMDYDYDDVKVKENLKAQNANISDKKVIGVVSPNIILSDAATHVGTLNKPANYEQDKTFLEIYTTFNTDPTEFYEVYVNHVDGKPYDVSDGSFVGVMTFFGANHSDPRNKTCLNGCCNPVSEDGKLMTVFKYEIKTSDKYDVVIYKHGGIKVPNLKVNKIEIKNYVK